MSLESAVEILGRARRGGYAIGYFESWNLESLQGVIDAAEQVRSPAIVGFNGDFLSRRNRIVPEKLELYAGLGRAACTTATVPCGLIFNECPDEQWVDRASTAGFNLVMPANPAISMAQYINWVASVVRRAHDHGVSVEGEVGRLPCGVTGASDGTGVPTDPQAAEQFVKATGVDFLAVSVGNVHVLIEGEQGLDLERLDAIRRRVDIPLVLHGGSAIAPAALKEAIRLGVAKINYGTYLKQRYLASLRRALEGEQSNPHELVGMGGAADILVAGRLAVRAAVLERIGNLGCVGKA